jgi:hypothetical protein
VRVVRALGGAEHVIHVGNERAWFCRAVVEAVGGCFGELVIVGWVGGFGLV